MKSITDIIAENIRSRRKDLNMTQGQLAAALGYSTKAISKWESGKGAPPTVMLPQLAHILQTDIDRLMKESDPQLFYLGIDGGGTKTEFALANADGHIVKTALLGTSNPSDIGINATLDILRLGISEVCGDIPKSNISVFAGLAGSITEGTFEIVSDFFNRFGFASASHGSDAMNAISAELGDGDGIISILGTGSVTYAQKDKKTYGVGGYGFLLGDEGSGFALGRDAINAALSYEDGSGDETALYELVQMNCKHKRVYNALSSFYRGGKRSIASYAPIVFKAYSDGDPIAARILEKNLYSVAQTIRGASKHLDGMSSPIPVVLCGGIGKNHAEHIIPILYRLLSEDEKAYDIKVSAHSLIYGALRLAGMTVKDE